MTTPPTANGMQLPFGTLHPELQQYDALQFEDPSTASPSGAIFLGTGINVFLQDDGIRTIWHNCAGKDANSAPSTALISRL
mgnify:CR=1 FL=1